MLHVTGMSYRHSVALHSINLLREEYVEEQAAIRAVLEWSHFVQDFTEHQPEGAIKVSPEVLSRCNDLLYAGVFSGNPLINGRKNTVILMFERTLYACFLVGSHAGLPTAFVTYAELKRTDPFKGTPYAELLGLYEKIEQPA